MKSILAFTTFVAFISIDSFSQSYKNKTLDYEKIKESKALCDTSVYEKINEGTSYLEMNQSESAVENIKSLIDNGTKCHEVKEAYATALFYNGKWDEAMEVLENLLLQEGKTESTILRHASFCLEMAENGINSKNIDGNTVYKHLKDSTISEEQFILKNYNIALNDLLYLCKDETNKERELYQIGYIYRKLKDYNESNRYYNKLLANEEIHDYAFAEIINNYISLKEFDKAINDLDILVKKYPKATSLYKQFVEVYQNKGDTIKAKEYGAKYYFYSWMANSSEQEYKFETFELLKYFGGDASSKEKSKKLKKLAKNKDKQYVADICLAILKIHANHHNNLENESANILAKLGKISINKVNDMFENEEVSTCTITNLASIMASVKDTLSWNLLINYLPKIVSMPMTLIPPAVPEYLLKFDEKNGLETLIAFNKELIEYILTNQKSTKSPMDNMSHFVFFAPLNKFPKEKIIALAQEKGYNKESLDYLLKETYDNGINDALKGFK